MIRNLLYLSDNTCIGSGVDQTNAIQNCTVTECVNSGKELTIGSTCCACLEVKIFAPGGELNIPTGKAVTLCKEVDGGAPVQVGVFLPERPVKANANVYKLTAYDNVSLLDKDVSAWLKGLKWPTAGYPLLTFAGMVCTACGLTLATTDIPNATMPVYQFYKAGVTGRQLMRWIGECAGRFCRANARGEIELAWYTASGVTVRATGDRYYFAGKLSYEDYNVAAIDAVKLRLADSDSGALWPPIVNGTVTYAYLRIRSGPGVNYADVGQLALGDTVRILEQKTVNGAVWGRIAEGWICITGYVKLETAEAENPYIITGNPILLSGEIAAHEPYLAVIQQELAKLPTYRPCKVSLPASMDIRPGHTVQIVDKNGVSFTTCVMTKIQKGQKDTLECTGSARRDSATTANNKTAAEIAAEQEAYAQSVAKQAVDEQAWKDLFNKWTDGGRIQGIFEQDGVWIFNAAAAVIINLVAEAIQAGKLKSVNGDSYFDLDKGKFVSTDAKQNATVIQGGAMWLQNSAGKKRIWMVHSDDQVWIYFADDAGNINGGVGAGFDHFMVMAPDEDEDGQIIGRKAVWKTINGEKVLCASS